MQRDVVGHLALDGGRLMRRPHPVLEDREQRARSGERDTVVATTSEYEHEDRERELAATHRRRVPLTR